MATLVSTLINTATSPDPYPERGIHNVTLTLGLLPACPVAREAASVAFNRPMTAVSTGSHPGSLPLAGTLFTAESDTGVFSALIPEEDGVSVRFYSVSDAPGTVRLSAGLPVKSACLTDLMGNKTGDCTVDGETVTAPIAPRAFAQVKIVF